MDEHYCFLMAGGVGERFWPASRIARPKHLWPIFSPSNLLADTFARVAPLAPKGQTLVVTRAAQVAAIGNTCPEIPAAAVVAEPTGRDTCAAAALSTLVAQLLAGPRSDPVCALFPADAVIHDSPSFRAVAGAAFAAAKQEDALVTLGIRPNYPSTGFGYLELGADAAPRRGQRVMEVRAFREKPALDVARQYVAGGGHLWNAGIFFWRASVFFAELRKHAPEHDRIFSALRDILGDLDAGDAPTLARRLPAALATVYDSIPKISVDYAIMEQAARVLTLEATFDWDDAGTWTALERHFPGDAAGNRAVGPAFARQSERCVVFNDEADGLVALYGVKDLMVVRAGGVTLVCPKDRAQDVKKLVQELAKEPDLQRFL